MENSVKDVTNLTTLPNAAEVQSVKFRQLDKLKKPQVQIHILFVGAIEHKNKTELTSDECHTTLDVEDHSVKFKVDTGSQVNILLLSVYKNLRVKQALTNCTTKLTSYSGENLKLKWRSCLSCQDKLIDFYIVDTTQYPILGLSASRELGIIKIILNINSNTNQFIKMFPKLFQGLGCLKTPYHIQIDSSIVPVVNPPQNQPAAIQDRLRETLNGNYEIIRKFDEPTEWVKLCVCLDLRPLNKAICRKHFQLPTLEDITTRLTEACVFSKLDANHGYWQVPLSIESQVLATFNSPFGR